MNNILEKNLKRLEDSGIKIDVNKATSKVRYVEDLKNTLVPILNVNENEYNVYSVCDAKENISTAISNLKIKSANVLIVFGSGLFYEIEEILSKWKEKGTVIVIEPDRDIFESNVLKTNILLENRLADIYYYVGKDITEKLISEFIVTKFGALNFYPVIFYANIGYKQAYPKEYRDVIKAVKEVTSDLTINFNTIGAFNVKSTVRVSETLSIFYDKCNTIRELENYYEGKPAIIVATGPSLLNNVKLLKEVQDKVLILAPYVALKVLEPLGIKADFAFSIDANQVLEDIHEDEGFDNDFVVSISGNSTIAKHCNGNSFIVNEAAYENFCEYLKVDGEELISLSTGGSVANSAADFARYVGCNKVILIGQDLSFKGKQTHAYADLLDDNTFDRYKVKGFYGEEVETYEIYDKYKKWFINFAEMYKDKIKCINATEGGVYIDGFEHMSLREVIDEHLKEEYNFSYELTEKFYPKKIDLESTLKLFEDELKLYRKMDSKLKPLMRNVKRMKVAFEKEDIKTPDISKFEKDIKKMTSFVKFFDKEIENIRFTKLILYVNYMSDFNGFPLEYSEDRIKAEQNYNFYGRLYESTKLGIVLLEKAIKKLEEVKEQKYGI
ncbi:MAG: motility associated factor glycosyltransferase family protein [Lachnospirales bacterium]